VPVPFWQCEIAALPFILTVTVLGLICLLVPSRGAALFRMSPVFPEIDLNVQTRVFGVFLLAVAGFVLADLLNGR
jgi:hypothetical protein